MKNPMTMEAIEWLAALGTTDKVVVLDAIDKGFESIAAVAGKPDDKEGENAAIPVKEFVAAHFAKGRHQTSMALQSFKSLEQKFPNNVYILLNVAILQVSPLLSEFLLVCF